MAQRSVIQEVARIVGLADILGVPRLRQFQLTAFVEQLEEGFDLVVLERVFDLGPIYETTPSRMRARCLLRVGRQGLLLGGQVLIATWRSPISSGRDVVVLLGYDVVMQFLC